MRQAPHIEPKIQQGYREAGQGGGSLLQGRASSQPRTKFRKGVLSPARGGPRLELLAQQPDPDPEFQWP